MEVFVCYFEGEDGYIYICIDFLLDEEIILCNVCVVFVLIKDVFFFIYDEDLFVFWLVCMCVWLCLGLVCNVKDVLMDLYVIDVEYLVDFIEEVYECFEDVSKCVLVDEVIDVVVVDVLEIIVCVEDLNGWIWCNVMDMCCVVLFLLCS